MSSHEPLDLRATLYPTPWQPLMLKGVPRDWAIFSLMVGAVAMGIAGLFGLRFYQIVGVLVAAVMAAIGWLLAKFDPYFFAVILVRIKIGSTKGRGDGNEYVA